MSAHTEHSWSVDAIAEGVARVEEDGARMLSVPRHLLPDGAAEGQLLKVTRAPGADADSVVVTIVIDRAATAKALRASAATTAQAMATSRKRDPGGDVAL